MHFLCELFRSRIIKFYVIWLKNVVFRLFAHSFRPRPPFNPIFSFSLKTHNGHHWHGFTHPGTALHNASEDWKLTPVEREIIKKHMFPLTPIPPTCREAWLVCLADKICAAKETTGGIYGKLPFAAKHNAQDK